MFLVMVNDKDGILNELAHVGFNRQDAERHFLYVCDEKISNFDEYDHDDIEAVLDDGYAKYGRGCVMFIDTSNCIGDKELVAQFGGNNG